MMPKTHHANSCFTWSWKHVRGRRFWYLRNNHATMITPWHGHALHIADHSWFSTQRASDEKRLFYLLLVLTICWTKCVFAGDARRHDTHVKNKTDLTFYFSPPDQRRKNVPLADLIRCDLGYEYLISIFKRCIINRIIASHDLLPAYAIYELHRAGIKFR